jgi:hypothetical protein
MRLFNLVLVAAALAVHASTAMAQSTLSAHGFGYPPGQLSTRSVGAGGALGEFDPFSALNPSALSLWGPSGLYVQYDPESRQFDPGPLPSSSSRISRLGIASGAVRVGTRGVIGIGTSTLLDRTWGTSLRGEAQIGPDLVGFEESYRTSGSVNDLRLAGAYTFSPRFAIGVGVHAFPGENRLSVRRVFDDSLTFGAINEDFTLSYTGLGISGGFQFKPTSWLGIAASGRLGGTMTMRQADTRLAEAHIPDRFGVGIRFDGVTGLVLAARVDRAYWSAMDGLGTSDVTTFDAWEYGAGADIVGPRLSGTATALRVGFRTRTLPFGVIGSRVDEHAISGGFGFPIAGGRASVDMGIERLFRSAAGIDAKERAWHFSLGLALRP